MENEIIDVKQEVQNPYNSILQLAISQGAPLEQLEKWMQLKRENEAYEASKAYVKAMAEFKASPPKIYKDKTVGYESKKEAGGKVGYSHATLGNVTELINLGLSPAGLHASWKTEQNDKGMITVTCTITHLLGHSESTSLTGPPDATGSKNSIQAIGSTISYLERYTLLSLTGIATFDMDDDGSGAYVDTFITGEELEKIKATLKETNSDIAVFSKYIGVASVDEIPTSLRPKVKQALWAKKKSLTPAKTDRQPGDES